ncbi:MAG: CPBP family intramembrane glutamic endopeptidase [Chloroflexota bacterium]
MDKQDTSLAVEEGDSEPVKQVWGAWATVGFGLAIGTAFLLTTLLVIIIFSVVNFTSNAAHSFLQLTKNLVNSEGLLLSLSSIVSTVVCFSLIIIIVKARRGATITEYLGLRPISKKTALKWLAITAGLVILSDGLSLMFQRPVDAGMLHIYKTSISPALLWVALVVFAPIIEETFFRSFLFEGFRQSRIGLVGTIILAALMWSLLHLSYGVFEVAVIFIGGILLGEARFKTGSLLTPVLMHAFWNLIAMIELVAIVAR